MVQHSAAFGSDTRTPAGGELHDDAAAELADAFLKLREFIGIRRRGLIVVSDVHVHERGARLEGLVRGFDLLVDGDRDSRIVFLTWHRAGDCDGDDAGEWFGVGHRYSWNNC